MAAATRMTTCSNRGRAGASKSSSAAAGKFNFGNVGMWILGESNAVPMIRLRGRSGKVWLEIRQHA